MPIKYGLVVGNKMTSFKKKRDRDKIARLLRGNITFSTVNLPSKKRKKRK